MQLSTTNGTVLDDEKLAAGTINAQLRRKRLDGLFHAFVATRTGGDMSYVLVDTHSGAIRYANNSLEAVGCFVDVLAL